MCKCIGTLLCVGVLAAAGVLAWRYGPWYEEGSETEASQPSFQAENTCATCCNGLASNCDLPVDQVVFPMVHNAYSSKEDYFLGYNNNERLEDALVAGYRGLMLDSCICDGSIGEKIQGFLKGEQMDANNLGFCHKSCDAGVRRPSEVMGNIKKFLEVNRNEVLIIEFEINDNSLEELYEAIDKSGIDKYVYRPAFVTEWPTMQSLIDYDTRLILFAHGDGMESCTQMACPEGIFYKFDHFQQTNWNDVNTCDVKGNAPRQDGGFFLMNHWMNDKSTDLPSATNAEQVNTYSSLTSRINKCEGGPPNVLAVDFWDVGDALAVVDEINQQKG